MRADLRLKQRQAFWETPRNIAILLTAVAALSGFLGWRLARTPPQQIVVHLDAPLSAPPAGK